MRNAKVITCKCGKTKGLYGMRTEEVSRNVWKINWAFKLSESRAKAEKYSSKIEGQINLDSEYPGCPYCGAVSFFLCGACNKITCWDGESKKVVCSHCNRELTLEGTITSLDTGDDI